MAALLLAGGLSACDALSSRRSPEFTAPVLAVVDGDVIEVSRDGAAVRVRLGGLDAPEAGQAFGDEARRGLLALVDGQLVRVRVIEEQDRYGRVRGEVLLADGRSVNEELVRAGLAWRQNRAWEDDRLERIESAARSAGLGLWADPGAEPPWDWKHRRRAGAAEAAGSDG